jgi:hypothetical protein
LRPNGGAQEKRSFAKSGQRRREHLVAVAIEPVGDAPPAPAAVPSTVHEHEDLPLRFSQKFFLFRVGALSAD